jgi:hypothetical protein
MSECIFCLEGEDAERAILHNVKCRCNYCFHKSCYEYYNRKTICPMCRADVGDLYNTVDSQATQPSVTSSPLPSPIPSAPEPSPLRTIVVQAPEESAVQPLYRVVHAEDIAVMVAPSPFATTPPGAAATAAATATATAETTEYSLCVRIGSAFVCVVVAVAFGIILYWYISH